MEKNVAQPPVAVRALDKSTAVDGCAAIPQINVDGALALPTPRNTDAQHAGSPEIGGGQFEVQNEPRFWDEMGRLGILRDAQAAGLIRKSQ